MARPRKSTVTDVIESPNPIQAIPLGGGLVAYPRIEVSASGDAAHDDLFLLRMYRGGQLYTLPPYIDDVDRDFGWGGYGSGGTVGGFTGLGSASIYDTMMNEPSCSASVGLLMASALNQEPVYAPPVPRSDPDFKQAVRLCDFICRNMCDMETPLMPIVREQAKGALTHGHKDSRKVYQWAQSEEVGGQAMWLRELHPKPNNAIQYAVDSLNQWAGVWPSYRGGMPQVDENGNVPGLEPKSLYAHAVYEPKNMDPRGSSALRPAYHPWYMLQQIYASKLKYLGVYGIPILHTTLPEGAVDETMDRTTNPPTPLPVPKSAAETQNNEFKKVRSGGVVTTAYGVTANLIQPTGEGQFYETAQAGEMARIAFSILYQELATMEGRHQARAASQVHQDALDVRVMSIRMWMEDFIYWQIIIPLIDINFGKQYRRLAPRPCLGRIGVRDMAAVGSVFAQLLASHGVALDIVNDVMTMMGMPRSYALDDWLDDHPDEAVKVLLPPEPIAKGVGAGSAGMGADHSNGPNGDAGAGQSPNAPGSQSRQGSEGYVS